MGNCFGSRAKRYYEGEILLFGVFNGDKIRYVFELIKSKGSYKLGDFEGKHRRNPTNEVQEIVNRYLKKVNKISI
tara:strand:+ start:12196 stop:12420 length:225 start_codon:yes stop_codon:yes gene_type:complete